MKNTKLKIKKGDTVKVLSGKDKGKTGKVLRIIPVLGKAVVENLNSHTKFQKSKQAGQPGTKVIISSPIYISKLMVVDGSGQSSRVGYKFLDNGTKQRITKSDGKTV